ncbi:hypothetical protein OPV22_023157 [Ensete ventricosum]|uniref:Protein WEAK CHLOROPLAST MOVEMENT UNDER BLUE LIGHT 1 n=1 Tax=Ensete ventricosum TaxID=4639 RepID=A0AAV8QMV7_ENSVE|nr:hypothetical protein OPV22_023157 [Ensete ventricosum]
MEETKAIEDRFSGEHLLTISCSSECLPTLGPPNFSCHDENIDTIHHQEGATKNAEKKVEQYIADNAEYIDRVDTNNQKEAIIKEPGLSLKYIVSDVPSLGQNTLDHIVVTNHQQGMILEDSVCPVQQGLSAISSQHHNIPDPQEIPNGLGDSIAGVAVMSYGDITHPVSHSFELQKTELESTPNQLQNGTSINLVGTLRVTDSTTLCESRKIMESTLSLPEKLYLQKDVGAPELATTAEPIKTVYINRGIVDTSAPFESVKEAVSKFGGIVDWKAHRQISLEKRKLLQLELERVQAEIPECKKRSEAAEEIRAQVLKELDRTKIIIEELKLNLEKAQMGEAQAKQDLEVAQMRVKEMEQGISSESSVAAKTRVELAKARHEAAVAELKKVKSELKTLQGEYVSLVSERDFATRQAEDATSGLKEIEMIAEELTLELITTKESLESAHAAHLEAEGRRIGAALAREQDCLTWEKELKHAEEELEQLNQQLLLTKDLKSKLETASALLLNLKAELAAYMESKLNQESQCIENKLSNDVEETKRTQSITQELSLTRNVLEEVKASIEKAQDEVDCLKVASSSLKSELDKEKACLTNLQQREGMASIAVSSLENELDRTKQDLEVVRAKEKAAREKMVELPKLLQHAAQEADQSKSVAQIAREELSKSKEEADEAKASAITIEIRLHAALKEIEAARSSERMALVAIKALQESEQAASICGADSPHSVTLPLDEYHNLSKRAHEAEELAHERIAAAIAQIDVAKQSEVKSLERLDDAYGEMRDRKEALKVATEKAEKANEGKLGAEQGLRKWRAENEQRRRAGETAKDLVDRPQETFEQPSGPGSSTKEESDAVHSMMDPKSYVPEDNSDNDVPKVKTRKKKKSLVPKIVLFLAREKSQPFK